MSIANHSHTQEHQKLHYDDLLPGFGSLCTKFHLDSPISFFLRRPSLKVEKFLQNAQGYASEQISTYCKKHNEPWSLESGISKCDFKVSYQGTRIFYVTLELYVAFWTLSLRDIALPSGLYEAQLRTLQSKVEVSEHGFAEGQGSEIERSQTMRSSSIIEQLESEFCVRREHNLKILEILEHNKRLLIVRNDDQQQADIIKEIVCKLVIPRVSMTYKDAMFCAHFFLHLHTIGTPNFISLDYFEAIFKYVAPMIFSATDNQAAALGIFLKATLAPLWSWMQDKRKYHAEAASRPGFDIGGNPCSHEQYCKKFAGWYDVLTKIFVGCLEKVEDYSRPCLLLLIKVKCKIVVYCLRLPAARRRLSVLFFSLRRFDLKSNEIRVPT